MSDYDILTWEIPADKLTPAVPGRADYVHFLADTLAEASRGGDIPIGEKVCACVCVCV